MTYLELCQMVTRESGTVSGTQPVSVAGQSGRLLKFVHWVNEAWRLIQNRRNAWRWMRAEFSGNTTAGAPRYTSLSWSLTRWAEWITEYDTVTIYKSSTGVSDEGALTYIDWTVYRRMYERGTQTNDRPVHYSISPAGELCLGPRPDDTYVVRGEYRKSPQALSENGDIPEIPVRFHDVIAWYAMLLMAEHDEATLHIAVATRRYRELMGELERDQLPMIHISAGALA